MTTADHSSCCLGPEGHIENGGAPGGFVLHVPHMNARIYHGGDTNVFMDMELIEELNKPNILMIPIGDRFTMGPEGAALACQKFFHSAKLIIPMHYGTFPLLTGTFEAFQAELEKKGVAKEKLVATDSIKDDPSKICAIQQAPIGVAQKIFEDNKEMIRSSGHIIESTVIRAYSDH